MMRREFEVFDSALKALPTKEHDIVFTFINKERKMLEIAEDRDLAYQTVKNLIGDIKKLLESRTVPYFRETLRRWTKGYTIKQPNMDCQPTEITTLMRHRAVFS